MQAMKNRLFALVFVATCSFGGGANAADPQWYLTENSVGETTAQVDGERGALGVVCSRGDLYLTVDRATPTERARLHLDNGDWFEFALEEGQAAFYGWVSRDDVRRLGAAGSARLSLSGDPQDFSLRGAGRTIRALSRACRSEIRARPPQITRMSPTG